MKRSLKLPFKLARLQTPMIIVSALAAGCLAVFGMREHIAEQLALESRKQNPKQDFVEALVAKNDLHIGDSVHERTIAVRRIPREYLPAQAIAVTRFETLSGRKLAIGLRAGDPLFESMLEQREAATFSSQLRAGVRALSVAVDEINSIAGMLQPGDRIDLHLSVKPNLATPTALSQEITTPLMADVRVLATGKQHRMQGHDNSLRNFSTITVEVSPEQAQRLIVAQRNGRITALLRPRDDTTQIETKAMDLAQVLQWPSPTVLAIPRPGPEIIVGGRGTLINQTGGQHASVR
jgi:pilus assembly protein CpaB